MSPQRRELRRRKKELADHHRAVNLRNFNESPALKAELRELGAAIETRADLDAVLTGFNGDERLRMLEALKPYLRIRLLSAGNSASGIKPASEGAE